MGASLTERYSERETGDSKEISMADDPYVFLDIVLNPDGSLTRPTSIPLSPPQPKPQQPYYVLSKDVPLNPSNNTSIRILRPHFLTSTAPLPIIIYFHGGGFIYCNAASAPYHVACEHMSSLVPAIVLSVEYRLAPEHPLPAAYDDAIDAIRWVRDQSISDLHRDTWMAPDLADFSRCFLMGTSAGSNIVYHVAIRALDLDPPFKISGVIMNQPFFGGVQRTESELRMAQDQIVPLHVTDLMWRLALPRGADRDHEFCNPITPGSHHDRVGSLPPCLVKGYSGDPLVDRQRTFVWMLEGRGVHVVGRFDEGGLHAVELFDSQKAQDLFTDVRDFISSVSNGHNNPSNEWDKATTMTTATTTTHMT
ncbi:probable carboxylesterase 8 [Magnolia sinica]|uniref:probable carboxylesterase 8 n=1 Tax=Magnolia sinica TaxID=86752 RepID=UPI00265B52C2|nr:probable carboxylesterase 8 [Magnolia sinica]